MLSFLVPASDAVERRRPALKNGGGFIASCVASALLAGVPVVGAAPHQIAGAHQAVATESGPATTAAMRILESGGNAVDAAVTAALVAGVASPSSSGMGGGGFALVWNAATREASALDFRETAPAATDIAAFERRPLPPAERGKLVGVPGEVAGLYELHRRFGKKAWTDLVRPAVRVALDGYPVSEHLETVLAFSASKLAADEGLTALFLTSAHPKPAGARITNPLLAATLKRVALEGPAAISSGSVAADLESSAASAGGALSRKDLPGYAPRERPPLHVRWEGYDVYTMGPPSGGGLVLGETLSMYGVTDLKPFDPKSAAYAHLLAEVFRGAMADRYRFISDPDQQPVDLARLLDPKRLAARRKNISADRTQPLPSFAAEEHGTHALVVADRFGNVVSLTTTVNRPFGSAIAGKTSGIVLNDELDDFTAAKAATALGVSDNPNRPRPNARPVSSMSPTIVVRDGVPLLALGGSGGSAIGPNVTQALLSRLVFGDSPIDSVSAPRLAIPTEGGTLDLEPSQPPAILEGLRKAGETIAIHPSFSAVQMIALDGTRLLPASDPRKHGVALAE